MIALVVADALLATFGGDTMGDVLAGGPAPPGALPGTAWRGHGRGRDGRPGLVAARRRGVGGDPGVRGRRVTQVLRFGLLGQGISYSASPAMMSAAFAALGLPHTYAIRDVTPAELPAAVRALRDADCRRSRT